VFGGWCLERAVLAVATSGNIDCPARLRWHMWKTTPARQAIAATADSVLPPGEI